MATILPSNAARIRTVAAYVDDLPAFFEQLKKR
jgi:hypothetical protein